MFEKNFFSPIVSKKSGTKTLYEHLYKKLYKHIKVEYTCYTMYSTVVLPHHQKEWIK